MLRCVENNKNLLPPPSRHTTHVLHEGKLVTRHGVPATELGVDLEAQVGQVLDLRRVDVLQQHALLHNHTRTIHKKQKQKQRRIVNGWVCQSRDTHTFVFTRPEALSRRSTKHRSNPCPPYSTRTVTRPSKHHLL